jgi:hypothetical protein
VLEYQLSKPSKIESGLREAKEHFISLFIENMSLIIEKLVKDLSYNYAFSKKKKFPLFTSGAI